MKTRTLDLSFLTLALALLFAIGCVTPVDEHWGDAYRANKAAMIQNPDAGSPDPVEGLDPITGQLVVERYEREQKKSPEQKRELFLIAD